MFMDNNQVFSIRKFKNGRVDSKLIGLAGIFLAVGCMSMTQVYADEVSNGSGEFTTFWRSETLTSHASVTFVDDDSGAKVKIDAVYEDGDYVIEPTRANFEDGRAAGHDDLNVRSEVVVNYVADQDDPLASKSDNPLLMTETISDGSGVIRTKYDKEGLNYDGDGKYYLKSDFIIKKQPKYVDPTMYADKGYLEANGKLYTPSWWHNMDGDEGRENVLYDSTKFNDIETTVSPLNMKDDSGHINYNEMKGSVYLVEETSDGHYGKFVKTDGVSSDSDAVAKWKEGVLSAKDFIKENVTLKEGDSILVLDKDTYALATSSTHIKTTKDGEITNKTVKSDDYSFKGKVKIDSKGDVTITNNDIVESKDKGTIETTKIINLKVKDVITPIRAYKVVKSARKVVKRYYRVKITKTDMSKPEVTKRGSVYVDYVTKDYKLLKSEIEKDNVAVETKVKSTAYSLDTIVDKRDIPRDEIVDYDVKPNKYPFLIDENTGFRYKYVGLNKYSAKESGRVQEGDTRVVYEYDLVSEEETVPSVSNLVKTGTVDVSYRIIDKNGYSKILKSDVILDKIPVEYEDVYLTKSNGHTVSERKSNRVNSKKYDTSSNKYVFLKEDSTGIVYDYVGLAKDSDAESGIINGDKHIIYEYRERANPITTFEKGTPEAYEQPEFTGGLNPNDAPRLKRIDYDGILSKNGEPEVHEKTEFKGGVNYLNSSVLKIPEYEKSFGIVSNDVPKVEILEYHFGVPEVHEKPEFKGGVITNEAPVHEKPELKIPDVKPFDKPKVSEKSFTPVVPQVIEGYVSPKLVETPSTQEPSLIKSFHSFEKSIAVKETVLPNTAGGNNMAINTLGALTLTSVLGLSVTKRKKEDN